MKENNRGASEIIKKFQAKNALKESNGPFHFLAQDNMEAILLVKDGICLEANQTAADMFGFTNFSELIDKEVRELFTAESYNLIKESLINSSDFHCAIGIHKTGTQFPITIQNKIMPGEMGDLFAFSIANITQNNRLQNINKTLFAISNAVNTTLDLNDLYRQIHILLSKIIDVTNFYIAIVNHEKRKIRFPYHVDQKDYDYEPIMDFDLNNSLTGLVVLKRKPILLDNKSLDQRFAKIDSWGPPCLIWMGVPLIIKDEVIGIIAVQSYTDPHLYNQQDLEILTSVSDQVAIAIDRKQAEDSLRESEKRYRQLFNNAPVGMYEIDFIEFRFVEVNQTMCAYLGYSEEEFLGMDPLMPFTEESQALFHERYEKILKGENVSENIEYNFIKKDGEQLCVLIKSDLIFENGKLTGARVVADDITERKKIEEMMIQSEKMMSVGGLAAGMAHEINNPLAGMIQNAQLVQNRLSKSLPVNEKIAEELGTSMAVIQKFMEKRDIFTKLENINNAGFRAAKIIDNMLSFAKKGVSVKSETNLAKLIDNTIELAQNEYNIKKKYDFKQIKIVRDYKPNLPPVFCEATKIQQVLFNLLKNASESMNRENQKNKYPQLNLCLKKDSKMISIEIEDNGSGMDDETQKHVFEPFFTTKSVDNGTGLGLSVSYFIIVDNHGGEMKVESCLGKGTKFIIKLPIN